MYNEKKALITTIILGVIDILVSNYATITSNGICLLISVSITFILMCILLVLINNYIRVKNSYEFIQFLFFGSEYNSFSFFPRLKLYMDYLGDKNDVEIETVEFECYSDNINNCANVSWRMENVYNRTKERITAYNLYTTSELGITKGEEVEVTTETGELKINVGAIKKKCGVQKTPFTFIKPINPNESISEIKINMKMYDAFDFTGSEVVYLYPRNYGKKINHLIIKCVIKGVENVSVHLHEIKRERNGYVDKPIFNGVPEKQTDIVLYKFRLNAEDINVENLYYLLIEPIIKE